MELVSEGASNACTFGGCSVSDCDRYNEKVWW